MVLAICPSNSIAMREKDSPKRSQKVMKGTEQPELEEEICEPLDANLKVNFDDPDLDDAGTICVILLHFTAIKQDVQLNEDPYHRGKIFQS